MPAPNFRKQKLVTPQERQQALNLLGNFIAGLPASVIVHMAQQIGMPPEGLKHDLSLAITLLAADHGDPQARQIIRDKKRKDRNGHNEGKTSVPGSAGDG